MSRVKCVVSCPIDVHAGYGARSRDLVKQLMRVRPNWDIRILSQRWGDCSFGYLEEHEEWKLLERVIYDLDFTPDVWIQITIPNEFQKVGKFNIGITAAMETTLCDPEWIKGCNRMDLVITSSTHGKKSLLESKWQSANGEKLEINVPIEVVFEGVDTDKFHPANKPESFKSPILKDLTTGWNFLCVGQWLQGDFGEDRKNIGYTVKAFLETFKDYSGEAPGLILKTCQAKSSAVDRDEVVRKIKAIAASVQYEKSLPKIFVLSGEILDEELNSVYCDSRVKAMVSFTKGEGFGRPLLEFSAIGKPIIVSGWSGHMDFLDSKYVAFVGGTLTPVHRSAVQQGLILPEAYWFTPKDSDVQLALMEVFKKHKDWRKKALNQKEITKKYWTIKHMGLWLDAILTNNLPCFYEKVELELPNNG